MYGIGLAQIAVFLATAALVAPLAKRYRIGSVLGYLIAGILIGPYGLGLIYLVYDVESVLHFAEFGVVLLLFVIGLELQPTRIWSLRNKIFGLGGLQVFLSGVVLAAFTWMVFNFSIASALFVGLALALSSTAFALQLLEEKGELRTPHGQNGFSVLLFQDLAAIPLIALVPVFAFALGKHTGGFDLISTLKAVGMVVFLVAAAHYLLNPIYQFVASFKTREAMTAMALFTVVGVAFLMHEVGLSAALGAFIAGAILADSQFRHQIEADISPFVSLLLGLFFIAIGMSLNIGLIFSTPFMIFILVIALVSLKALILFGLGLASGLNYTSASRFALLLSQGGEFAFVLFASGTQAGILSSEHADLLKVAVTISMALTPLFLLGHEFFTKNVKEEQKVFDTLPEKDGHIVVAGLGRFGQITTRILAAKGIPFIALDSDASELEFLKKAGYTGYYGDTSRLDILYAAKTDQASAFVLALSDVDESLRTARMVRENFPDLPIYARARNRRHVYWLKDLGIEFIERETFLSSLNMTENLLSGLGMSEAEVEYTISTFHRHDEEMLNQGYEHATDMEKLQKRSRSANRELEILLQSDDAR